MNADKLIQTIKAAGYKWCTYSGRGMYGAQCVAVALEVRNDLFELVQDLAEHSRERIPTPHTDQLGRGIIAYWPNARIEVTEGGKP